MTVHGGDVWQVAAELGIPASEILDFSANVNPRGLPQRALERLARDAANSHLLTLYPDPSACHLREALSRALDVPAEAIVIGPGAAALLEPALRSTGARRALVPVPAFSEYRRVCEQQGVEFVPFALDRSESFRIPIDRFNRAVEAGNFGTIFLNNPHNPSGALSDAREIRATSAALLLDEAFIDYVPDATRVREAASQRGLIVLRSLTKFFGCPALRVGYLVAHPDTARRIAEFLPAWPVTQLAIDALAEALADPDYAETSLRENASAREALRTELESLGLFVFPSAANYLLLELQPGMPPSSELRLLLARNHRILIRNCDSYEGLAHGRYVRVAVRSAFENIRLIDALAREL